MFLVAGNAAVVPINIVLGMDLYQFTRKKLTSRFFENMQFIGMNVSLVA